MSLEEQKILNERAKYREFVKMLGELHLSDPYLPILQSQGFDEWASVSELTPEILQEIGIENGFDAPQILACVNAARNVEAPPIIPSGVTKQLVESEEVPE